MCIYYITYIYIHALHIKTIFTCLGSPSNRFTDLKAPKNSWIILQSFDAENKFTAAMPPDTPPQILTYVKPQSIASIHGLLCVLRDKGHPPKTAIDGVWRKRGFYFCRESTSDSTAVSVSRRPVASLCSVSVISNAGRNNVTSLNH